MKTKPIILFLLLYAVVTQGQINFAKGYFITNEGSRIECFIRNYHWKKSPEEIKYRLSDTGTIRSIDISAIKAFELYDVTKYLRLKTLIDRSTSDPQFMTVEKNPAWSEEILLLEVVVEGKATLYHYQDNDIERFFYRLGDSAIIQLVYKQYLKPDEGSENQSTRIATNSFYRNQLLTFLNCPDEKLTDIQEVDYTLRDLEKYFIRYNACKGSPYSVFSKKANEHLLHLSIVPGMNYSMFHISNRFDESLYFDFGNKINAQASIEAEYILPVGNRRIGLQFAPTYQYLNVQSQNDFGKATLKFSSIDFPMGIRYYFPAIRKLAFFADAYVIPGASIMFNSAIEIDFNYAVPIKISTDLSYSAGAGVKIGKFSSAVRYYFNRQLLSKSDFWESDYSRVALLVGYSIF